jgi:hypothetical protein
VRLWYPLEACNELLLAVECKDRRRERCVVKGWSVFVNGMLYLWLCADVWHGELISSSQTG